MVVDEPVTLDMAKRQCRAEGSTVDDEDFAELITDAREHVERYCNIRLVTTAAEEMTFASFEDMARLTHAPVQSVEEVRYLDTNGVEQLLDPSVYELGAVESDPLQPYIRLAFGKRWPALRLVSDAVRVKATVGYLVVPRPIVRAMLLLISQWYDVRTAVQVDGRGAPAEIPNALTALLTNFRR